MVEVEQGRDQVTGIVTMERRVKSTVCMFHGGEERDVIADRKL